MLEMLSCRAVLRCLGGAKWARCIMRATGVSEMRARKALHEAYLDPVEAILNIKCA